MTQELEEVFRTKGQTPESITDIMKGIDAFITDLQKPVVPELPTTYDFEPYTLSPEEATDYGITLEEGWSLEVAPTPDKSGVSTTLIDSEGWRLTDEGIYISPEGEQYTEEGIKKLQAQQEAFQGAMSAVFPNLSFDEVMALSDEDPEGFSLHIYEIGRTDDTTNFLQGMGFSEEDIAAFFGETPKTNLIDWLLGLPERAISAISGLWTGREDVMERILDLPEHLQGFLERFSKASWQEKVEILSMPQMKAAEITLTAMSPVFELAEKYVFFPWRLAIAKALVLAEREREQHDLAFLDALSRSAQEHGTIGYVVSEDAMKAYETWINACGRETGKRTGTIIYWLSELSNPVFWIPYGKIIRVAKGVAVFGKVTGKVPKVITATERGLANPIANPTHLAGDGLRTLTGKFKTIPLPEVPSIEETLAFIAKNHPGRLGRGAWGRIRGLGDVEGTVKSSRLIQVARDELGGTYSDFAVSQLDLICNIEKVLGIKEGYVTVGITGAKVGAPKVAGKVSRAWGDIFEHWKFYNFADPRAKAWIEASHTLIDDVTKLAAKHGIEFDKAFYGEMAHYFPRGGVTGLKGVTEQTYVRVGAAIPGAKISAMRHRVFEFMEEGLILGYKYATPREALQAYIHGTYRLIGNKQAIDILRPLLKPLPIEAERLLATLLKIQRGQKVVVSAALERNFPEMASRIKAVLKMPLGKPRNEAITKLVEEARAITPEWLTGAITRAAVARTAAGSAEKLQLVLQRIRRGETPHPSTMRWLETRYPPLIDRVRQMIAAEGAEKQRIFQELLKEAKSITAEAKAVAEAALKERASVMEMASHRGFTEGMVDIPGLRNRIFADITVNGKRITGREVAQMVDKAFKETAPVWLNIPSQVSRGSVTLVAALDTSAPFIQGLYTLGIDVLNWLHFRPSMIWAKTAIDHVYVMLNPKYLATFRAKHTATYMKYQPHGLITASDLTDFYRGLALINKTFGKIPILGKAVTVPYGRTSIGFGAWGEMARIKIIESLERAWLRGGGTRSELVEFVNMMTGVVSTRGIGVGATQRAAESAALFAPRYFRANLMLLRALGKGGMTGKMAREVFGGMAAGWLLAYCGVSALMGQDPKLNPAPKKFGGDGAEFLTVQVGEHNIGLPGFLYGFIKMFAGVITTAINEPNKLIRFDLETILADHPEFRWLFGKSSPLVHLTKEMVTGRDFLGNRLDTTTDYLEQVAEKFLSIALQSIITQDPPATPGVFMAEILGLRTFPESAWEKFNDRADELIAGMLTSELDKGQLEKRAEGSLGWRDLDKLQQARLLEAYPDLVELYDAAISSSERRETDEWREWGNENDRISGERDEAEATTLEKFRDATQEFTIVDLRNALSDIGSESRIKWDELKKRFPAIYEVFEKNRIEGVEDLPLFEQAYNEWYDWVLYGPGTQDELGDVIWSVVEQRRREWMEKWGEEYYEMIIEVRKYGFADKDDLLFKIWEDKQRLWEYWQITDDLGNSDRAARLEYRLDPDNLDIEARLIFLGYVSTIQNLEAEEVVKQWCKEHNVSLDDIPAFAKFIISEAEMKKYGISDPYILRKYYDAEAGNVRKLMRWDNPGLDAYLVDTKGYTPIRDYWSPPEEEVVEETEAGS